MVHLLGVSLAAFEVIEEQPLVLLLYPPEIAGSAQTTRLKVHCPCSLLTRHPSDEVTI
jgi:hypothetical protein